MKYLKCLGFIFIPIIVIGIILTVLYYFDILGSNMFKILSTIVTFISMIVGGIYLGKNSKSKGYLEGLKVGGGIAIVFFLIKFLGFEKSITIKNIIYYLLIIISVTIGSMFGIRNVNIEKK